MDDHDDDDDYDDDDDDDLAFSSYFLLCVDLERKKPRSLSA